MPSDRHLHLHRKRTARLSLAAIFFLLAVSDAALARYTLGAQNPWPLLIGVLLGYTLSGLLLIAAIWRRRPWARYVLIALLWAVVGVYSLVALILGSQPQLRPNRSLLLIGIGVVLIVASNVWLISSRRIRYLASIPSSGG